MKETKYRVELTQDELNDIWRAKLMLDHPDSLGQLAIHSLSKRLEKLVERIKADCIEVKNAQDKL